MGMTISYLVNHRSCHETELIVDEDMIPESDRLNISVIGSGTDGLAFATTTARVGHQFTQYNRANEIGG